MKVGIGIALLVAWTTLVGFVSYRVTSRHVRGKVENGHIAFLDIEPSLDKNWTIIGDAVAIRPGWHVTITNINIDEERKTVEIIPPTPGPCSDLFKHAAEVRNAGNSSGSNGNGAGGG